MNILSPDCSSGRLGLCQDVFLNCADTYFSPVFGRKDKLEGRSAYGKTNPYSPFDKPEAITLPT